MYLHIGFWGGLAGVKGMKNKAQNPHSEKTQFLC